MPRQPQAVRTTFQGIEVWISPDVPELTSECNGFHGTMYEREATAILPGLGDPLDRIEVHPGALVFVFQRSLNVACLAVGVPDVALPGPVSTPTIWQRLVV